MKTKLRFTKEIPLTKSTLKLTVKRVDDETVEVVKWKRKPPTADRFSKVKNEEGKHYPIRLLGLGVETWEELLRKEAT